MEQVTKATFITRIPYNVWKPRTVAVIMDGKRGNQTDPALGELTLPASIVDV